VAFTLVRELQAVLTAQQFEWQIATRQPAELGLGSDVIEAAHVVAAKWPTVQPL